MAVKSPFYNAKEIPANEIKRGDIIAFKDFHTGKQFRGIVYNYMLRPNTVDFKDPTSEEVSGFLVLPVETTGKNKNSQRPPFSTIVKDSLTIVSEAGGDPDKNQTVVSFNIRTVANMEKMTGAERKAHVWVVGSYWDNPYMIQMLDHASDLYKKGQLYKDGQKLDPEKKFNIISSASFRDVVLGDRFNRNRTLANLSTQNATTGASSLGDIAKDQTVVRKPAKPGAAPSPVPKPAPAPAPVPVPTPAPVPETAPVEVETDVKKLFDVNLKDIFPVLNRGGEWNGVTKLRGGAYDNEDNKPVPDPQTGEKTKVLTTLREAWTYMKDVSGNLDSEKIAETLQQVGPITPVAVTKTLGILQHMFDELNKVQVSDGQMQTKDSVIQVLIDRGLVFEAK